MIAYKTDKDLIKYDCKQIMKSIIKSLLLS